MKTPEVFVQTYIGKAVNKGKGWNDSAYGYQCVAGFKTGCEWLGIPVKPTPNNWADGYWTCLNKDGSPNADIAAWQEKYFDKIRGSMNFRDGDWVIWGRNGASPSHPSSHIAMYYHGQEFGQNQGGSGGFCLKNTDFTDALGALRPKTWARIAEYESDITVNGHSYHMYGQSASLRTVVLSPGINETATIHDMDCDYWIYAKICGVNLFQNNPDNPAGQPYGMTFGDLSAPISGAYQTLPDQDSTLYLDIETGEYGDCTGVVIDPTHNVFSPQLIYPQGKNVQYAKEFGLGVKNIASMYTFAIRYTNGMYVFGITNSDQTPDQIAGDFMTLPDVDLIAILDGGGSAEMMRYNMKEYRVEYLHDTGRKTSGCLAMIGAPITIPADPIQPEPAPTDPSETEKDEEIPMEEEKPQEQPEMEPVEGWKDPEPQTNVIVDRIAALMSVKSILTLALTVVFAYLVMNQIAIPDFFSDIYKIVILFFFGYQTGKTEGMKK